MPVSVLVDATSIPPSSGGVGRYLTELIPALARRDDVTVHVACQPRDSGWLRSAAPTAVVHPVVGIESVPRRLLWEQLRLPRLARSVGAAVVHSPHYTMPLRIRLPVVVTLHDATFFSHPSLHGRVKGPFFRSWIRLAVRRAARCIAPSRATAAEVERYAGPPASPIAVAYHGVDAFQYSPERRADDAEMRARLAIGEAPYIAFLGTIEPRKNVVALLGAVESLGRGTAGLDPAPRLLLAGGRGWDAEALDLLDSATDEDSYRWLGYVDEDILPAFVAGADLVAYPSVGEGFGLPILEAMASGVPVVTTRILAAPEVGGDAAVYCTPDAASIADAIRGLLTDPAAAAVRGAAGRERALEFTWDESARRHAQVYIEAAGVAE